MEPPSLAELELEERAQQAPGGAAAPQARARDEEAARAAQAVSQLRASKRALGEEVSLLDEMVAAQHAARAVAAERKASEQRAAAATFGDGLEEAMRARRARRAERRTVLDALREQGNGAFKRGDGAAAEELYSRALQLCRAEGDEWYEGETALLGNRAMTRLQLLQRPTEALADAEAGLKLDAKWAKGYLWRARCLQALGRGAAAAQCLEKGVAALGRASKEGEALLAELKKTFPQQYELLLMPTLGAGASKGDNAQGGANMLGGAAQAQATGLELPEVQAAMVDKLSGGEWANDNLARLIAENPILSKGMADPRGAELLRGLQASPTETLKRYAGSPEASAFVQEMMKVLGTHFIQMGEEEERRKQALLAPQPPSPPPILTKEEAELQRQADKMLRNPDIKRVLEDPETSKVLQQCGDPRQLRRFMSDTVWGPRLRLLIDNGLVKIDK
jgi:hypothetical protein